ncbi:hypothetical protein CANARDRAFT_191189, partial [[Candida] arabinofermentans NRRL YB-2248]
DLATTKHIKYFNRFLGVLPSKLESEDSNKLAIIYFTLCGLDLLLPTKSTPEQKSLHDYVPATEYIEWIYTHVIETETHYGFRGSSIYEGTGKYDVINLAPSCFALQILVILGDDLSRINRAKLMRYVMLCQRTNDDGSFGPFVLNGEITGDRDARYCMMACTIRKLIKWGDYPGDDVVGDIDMVLLSKYIKSTVAFDGGMAMETGGESHAGLTFCGLDSLSLSGYLNEHSDTEFKDTIDFLVHRQLFFGEANKAELQENDYADLEDMGGFNGRLNKYADTCYAFWCIGSLCLLGFTELIDKSAVVNFLLNQTQSHLMGGFCKTNDPDELPDPLHSFLGLAALSL